MARTRKSKQIRAGEKLVSVLDSIKENNNITGTEAGDFLAEFFISTAKRKKIIENIKREVIF